ncbi:MAG: phospholipid carrier-dependent glycosyltransferase [Bacillota bacterium]
MKKLLFGCLIAALLLGAAAAEGDSLLQNGGFESVTASGMPDGWYTVSYRDMDSNTLFEITDEEAHTGTHSAKIVNANLNDARFVTVVNVEPESMYRVSGYILVKEMSDVGNGANFALENLYTMSESVFETGGEWRYVEWYGETDADQTSVELGVRVGGYSAESKGTAYFDDIKVEKVQTLPENVFADVWFSLQTDDTAAVTQESAQKSTGLFILLGLLFAGLSYLSARYLLTDERKLTASNQKTIGLFALGMMAAFVLRLILGAAVKGYDVDIGCFSAWSLRMASVGPFGFYTSDYFCDYPPGYILMLWPVGQIIQAIGYSLSPSVLLLLKIIPILCDMLTAMLLFSFAKKHVSAKAAAFLGLFFAFNPTVLVTGSAWGQADSLLALLLVVTAIAAADKKWRVALPVFIVSILIKPQALLFAPVGLVWLAASVLFDDRAGRKRQYRQLWQGAALVIIVPFQIRQPDFLWLLKRYQETLASYDYAALNTANLMYLLGGNWSALSASSGRAVRVLSVWQPILTGLALLSVGVWQLGVTRGFKSVKARATALWQGLVRKENGTNDSRKFMLAALCAVFGLAFLVSAFWPSTFLIYGTMWMAVVYTAALLLVVVERRAEALPFYMALMLIGVYVLGLKIHERYLFAACALLPLAYIRVKDRRLLWLCAGLSVTAFINTAIVLDNSILFGSLMGHLNADTGAVNAILCVANLLLCGYAATIAFTGLKQSEPLRKSNFRLYAGTETHTERLLHPGDARLRLNLRDLLIMGITFIVYCAVAFVNLGSLKAPQTAWVSASGEDQVVFELEEETMFKLLYFAGVSYHNFSVSVSDDGETWSDETICRMREGLCYRWLYATKAMVQDINTTQFLSDSENNVVWLTGKYLRVNAGFAGLNLKEIILRDENGDRVPVSLVSYFSPNDELKTDTRPENLIDEQDTLSGEPGFINGTYFDEIYYARTAYEHLHGQAPYETSHPPLGKLMMSVGIAVFGMTPFGWRFMGAFIGALMLPAMYLFGKQLTKNRWFAAFAMLLMTLDLMHFTQTRLATIDSFPVFFIILSYLCMTRYVMSDSFAVPSPDAKPRLITKSFVRSLIPLFLSGLFMGLAIASKWTGLYAAVGLAALFVYALYRQFRAGLTAHDLDERRLTKAEAARVRWSRALLLKRIFITCGLCVLFFIAIPLVIYYLSYIPYLSPTGPVTLQRILLTQQGMLSYHSTPGLGMDHPFYSPWWQWPLILKPIWYAQDSYLASGYGANIICLGNPAVFYAGALAMIAVFALLLRNTLRRKDDLRERMDQPAYLILAVSFLAQYLPWALVPRSMFFYHYFASLPFIILATMLTAAQIQNEKLRKALMIGLLAASLTFFIMFYPYASGMTVSRDYMNFLRWFPNLPV